MSRGGERERGGDRPEREPPAGATVQRPAWLTAEERARFKALGPARFADPAYQRYVQSFRTSQSLSEAGRKGYDVTLARYGPDVVLDHVAGWRRAHPSREEERLHTVLAYIGVEPYEREYRVAPLRVWADVAWPERGQIIEVYGGVHFGPLFDPDGTIAAHDLERQERIEAQGWEVLVVTHEDLRRENLPGTIAAIRDFLDMEREEPTR